MKDADASITNILALYQRLIAAPLLPKGKQSRGDWPGWVPGDTWHPGECGVYILWEHTGDLLAGRAPVYVGEGQLGARIMAHFRKRPWQWQNAQFLVDPMTSGGDVESNRWRRAVERFAILVLEPKENIE